MAPALQPVPRMLRCIAIVAALHGAARADTFQPPASVPQAQDRYVHAKSLFATKRFADAASEFAAAYQLDPDAKFLLFDVALAQRMAGACSEAIAAYRAFLDANPPDQYAAAAHVGIERCEHASPPSAPAPAPARSAPPPVTPVPVQPAASSWYRDGLGDGLVIAGAAATITAGVLYLLARGAASETFSATSLPDYHDSRDAASTDQTASWIAVGAGAALVAAGVIRYAVRPSGAIAIAPVRGGAMLALGGSF